MKAQGSMEYLIMTAAILAIASVVILFSTGFFGGQQGTASFNACRQAAETCEANKFSTPDDPCLNCEEPCTGTLGGTTTGKDLISNTPGCGIACGYCKLGMASQIYANNTAAPFEPLSADAAEVTGGWSAATTTPNLFQEAKAGAYSINSSVSLGTDLSFAFANMSNWYTGTVGAGHLIDGTKYGKVNFWIKTNYTHNMTFYIYTNNPAVCDGSGYPKYWYHCRYMSTKPLVANAWTHVSLNVPYDFTVPYSAANISRIATVGFRNGAANNVSYIVDSLYFQRTA